MTQIYTLANGHNPYPDGTETVEWTQIARTTEPFVVIDYHKSTKDYSGIRQKKYGVTRYSRSRVTMGLIHSERGWFRTYAKALARAREIAAEDFQKRT